jgi:hypothetical protein
MPPGRISKASCPPEIHYRPSNAERAFLDSLGPGAAKEKIASIILNEARKQCPDSIIEIQAKLIDIRKELASLTKIEKRLMERLESLEPNEERVEELYKEIHKAVHPGFAP